MQDNEAAVAVLETPKFVAHPIFWWDTGRTQDREYNHSFENPREAAFVVHLAFYLFQNGVAPEQLHVLAPYRAQVACIGKYAREKFGRDRKNKQMLQQLQRQRDETFVRGRNYAADKRPAPDGISCSSQALSSSSNAPAGGGIRGGPGEENAAVASKVDGFALQPQHGNHQKQEQTDSEQQQTAIDSRERNFLDAFVKNITPIDGFQGNQNKYIIISWTRSNPDHICGFLKRPEGINRRIVAQSRARCGLFMVGDVSNFEYDVPKRNLFAEQVGRTGGTSGTTRSGNTKNSSKSPSKKKNSKGKNATISAASGGLDAKDLRMINAADDNKTANELWKTRFVDLLREDDRVSPYLPLCCPRHPEKKLQCAAPEDFPNFALGKNLICREKCGKVIDACGHTCEQLCHSGPCSQALCVREVEIPCSRFPATHPKKKVPCCSRLLWSTSWSSSISGASSAAGDVTLNTTCITAGCGATRAISALSLQPICEEIVELACTHCGKPSKKKCGKLPQLQQPGEYVCRKKFKCHKDPEHTLVRYCNEQEADIKCTQKCGKQLPCGHPCPLLCGEDCSLAVCKKIIWITCAAGRHKQKVYCDDFKKQAEEEAAKIMDKNAAAAATTEAAAPTSTFTSKKLCKQEVKFRCTKCAGSLVRYCYQAEADIKCDHYCRRKLKCGHQCTRLCHEPCPETPEECLVCREDMKKNFFRFVDDFEDDEEAAEEEELLSRRSSKNGMPGMPSSSSTSSSSSAASSSDQATNAGCSSSTSATTPRSTRKKRNLNRDKEKKHVKTLHLSEIRYSQNSCSDHFRNGDNLFETLEKLRADEELLNSFPSIEVVEYEEMFFSMDNRRLFLLKQLYSDHTLIETIYYPDPAEYGKSLFFKKMRKNLESGDVRENLKSLWAIEVKPFNPKRKGVSRRA
ncbi:unnamed protein product [Amoebophrya sp. A120]|nr:unnamed protein product [Amoebophrya sp. A120]|eukprot:GSA120T00007738001.1